MENPFKNLVINNVYSNSDIKEKIKELGISLDNPMAFTYNRWNKGMTKIQPYFEYLGNGNYRYIGDNTIAKYTGIVVHSPKDSYEYKIAKWNEGNLEFQGDDISNFKDWRISLEDGVRIVSINSKILLKMNGADKRYMIQKTNEKELFEDGHKVISDESPLGKLLLEKTVGDSFDFGTSKIEIIAIS